MSSLRALKRKSLQKHKNISKDHLQLSKSTENLQSSNNKVNSALRRSKSESDISNISPSKNTKHYGKSERNLESLFITSTPCSTLMSSPENMQSSSFSIIADSDQIKIPIIGYEVMEERSRFTIFKLRIENYDKNNFWLVLRRFTDFTRLHAKLKLSFPKVNLVLPKKKWFGNNFSSGFIDNRISGLQTFINTILSNSELRASPIVREFFCLDDPPISSESIEECKAIFEAQEETIAHLKMQVKAKDEMISNLSHELHIQKQENEYLLQVLKKENYN